MIALPDPAATMRAGERLGQCVRAGDVVLLSGELGAGKTSFARGVLRALGHDGEVASPTFPIVIPYDELSLPVAHVDLYRVEDPDELEELGLRDFVADGVLLIEWPERLGARGWPGALNLRLEPHGTGRSLTAQVPTAWEGRWPFP